MITWVGARLRRNLGLLAAMPLVALMLSVYSWLQSSRPRVSWTNPGTMSSSDVDHPYYRFSPESGEEQVEFSPEGRVLLTFDRARARIRDLSTGSVALLHHDQEKFGHRYRPRLDVIDWMEGGRLLVGVVNGSDRPEDIIPSLQVWELPSGQERMHIPDVGDGSEHSKFVISGDGSTLAYLMGPPGPLTVGVWKGLKDWQPRYFPGCGPISLSADGRRLALFDSKSKISDIIVWDVNTSEQVGRIPPPSDLRPGDIALSPDGKILAESRNFETVLWDVATSTRKHVLETETTGPPWFSPDGSLFYKYKYTGRNGHDIVPIEIWNLVANPPQRIFYGTIADRSSDGHQIVQRGANYCETTGSEVMVRHFDPLKVVELPSMKSGRSFQESSVNEKSLSLDGRSLAVLTRRANDEWFWRIKAWFSIKFLSTPPPRLVDEEKAQVLDSESGRILNSINLSGRGLDVKGLKLLGDGKTLAIRFTTRNPNPESSDLYGTESQVELWDVPGPASNWPVVGVLSMIALGLGRWYDRRARRRSASSSPTPSIA